MRYFFVPVVLFLTFGKIENSFCSFFTLMTSFIFIGASSETARTLWTSNFALHNWLSHWNNTRVNYGDENFEIIKNERTPFLRVHFPKGSWSPGATQRAGIPRGGTQWQSNLLHPELTDCTL